MIKKIFSLLLLVSVINFAQETFGPVNSDYRMSLWSNYNGNPVWDGELKSDSVDIPIGYIHGDIINRIAFQWDVDYNDIPSNSIIDTVEITYYYSLEYGEEEQMPLHIYSLDYSLDVTNPEEDKLYLGMEYNSSYGSKISESHADPNEVTYKSNSYTIDDWRSAINDALQNGKLVLGLKSNIETWEEAHDRLYKIKSSYVTLKIDFTPPVRNVTLNQKLENGTTNVGKLKLWEGNNWSADINPGTVKTFNIGSNQVLLGDQNVHSSQKYNNWDGSLNDVINYKSFQISDKTDNFQSNFKATHQTITVQNSLEGTSATAGTIQFFDPWLIDTADPAYANQMKNRGMAAEFIPQTSPFTPNYTSSYNGKVYKGVFTNQDYQYQNTYYKVKAAPTQTKQINGSNYTLNFIGWDGTNVEYQNSNSLETGVVFKSSNSVAKANYKGINLTNSSSTFARNNQRKVYSVYPNNQLLMVYESMGKIWLEKSTDGGSTWTLCNNGQPLNNSGTASEASIALDDSAYPWHYIAFREIDNGLEYIKIISLDDQYNLQQRYTVTSTTGSRSNPVIGITGGSSSPRKMIVAWKESSVLKYRTANISNGITWLDSSPQNVSYTNSNSINPTLECGETEAHLAWEQSNTIKYIKYNFGSSSFSSYTTVSDYNSTLNTHNKPSLTVVNNNPRVSWLASHYMTYMRVAAVREYNSGWGSVSFYANKDEDITNSQINRTRDGYHLLGWSIANGLENKYIKSSSPSSIKTASQSGKYIQVTSEAPNFGDAKIIAQKVNTTPYSFATSSVSSGLSKSSLKTINGKISTIEIQNKEFCFDIYDLTVDKENISFEDDIQEKPNNELFRSEIFTLDKNSKLGLNFNSKIIDDETKLTEDYRVDFTLQIVDASTDEILGNISNILFDRNDNSTKKGNYRVNINESGNKDVYIRLLSKNSSNGKVTLVDYYMDGSEDVSKENIKEITIDNSSNIKEYQLFSNYPNPFNPTTVIKYQIPQASHVKVKIYDMLGSEVKTLINKVQDKGRYEVTFNAENLPSGVYIYSINANNYSSSRKMLLIK